MALLQSKTLRNGELLTLETCTIAGAATWVLVWQEPAAKGRKAKMLDTIHATKESVALAKFNRTT